MRRAGRPQVSSVRTRDIFQTFLILAMLGGFALMLGRVVQLKVSPDARILAVVAPRFSSRPEQARRGDLLDARGRVLATSTVGYRLFVDPAEVEDLLTVAVDIADAIGVSPAEIDRKILSARSPRYVVIEQLLDEQQVEAVRRLNLRGVDLEPRLVRRYPHGDLAAMVVGMVGFEHTGLSGVEHVLNGTLTQRQGKLTYLRDARRKAIWIEPEGYVPPADGRDIRLTIDLVIQQIADRRLREGVLRNEAGGGRAVVLDCRTGGILAMCDLLREREGWDEITIDPARAVHPALGRNRCVTDPYEPGSTLKPFVWAIATELGLADPDEIIDTPSEPAHRTSYGRRIRDTTYWGPVTWREVLVKSINSGMAIVAERMTHRQMQETLQRFGFGARTGCGIAGESPGLITRPGQWSHYTQSSVSFGHELAVTAVQMVRAFSALARDGTLVELGLIAPEDGGPEFPAVRRACAPETARLVRGVMRDVVLEGSARAARSDLYDLFGKSGTAQLPDPDGGGYFEDRYVSSFIAGAPADDPQIVVLCVIDDPDRARGHFGGAIAGPVVREIVEETLQYLGVPAKPAPDGQLSAVTP